MPICSFGFSLRFDAIACVFVANWKITKQGFLAKDSSLRQTYFMAEISESHPLSILAFILNLNARSLIAYELDSSHYYLGHINATFTLKQTLKVFNCDKHWI